MNRIFIELDANLTWDAREVKFTNLNLDDIQIQVN